MAARLLSSSSLSGLVRHGSIGPVYASGHELLRRIFVTVRDRNWQEVAPCKGTSEVDESRGVVKLAARHTSECVDFEWQGVLQVSKDRRTLCFEFEGTVLRDMDVCRLGLIVLHPIAEFVGSKVTAHGPLGEQRITVQREIAPQPLIEGVPGAMTEPFSVLRIERDDFGALELRFAGDLFELEDQRNWGDASFKSYCTPLRMGFPRSLPAGTAISHRVEARFTPASVQRAVSPSRLNQMHKSEGEPDSEKLGRVPTIGRVVRAHSHSCGLDWDHIHMEVTGPESFAALRERLADSDSQNVSVGIEAGEGDLLPEDWVGLIWAYRTRICRLLIHGAGGSIPTATALEIWGQRLGNPGERVPLFASTRGYYVEFNRRKQIHAAVRGMAFPLTATVHSDDVSTVAENVATIQDMVDTLQGLGYSSEIILAPLALYYPDSVPVRTLPQQIIEPWLAATLIHAAAAGVTSVTLAEDVVEALSSSSEQHTSFFLTRLLECAGCELWAQPIDEALPSGVYVAAIKQAGQEASRLLAANLTSNPAELVLPSAGKVAVPAYAVTWAELIDGKLVS